LVPREASGLPLWALSRTWGILHRVPGSLPCLSSPPNPRVSDTARSGSLLRQNITERPRRPRSPAQSSWFRLSVRPHQVSLVALFWASNRNRMLRIGA
jgi:hypothetical protein